MGQPKVFEVQGNEVRKTKQKKKVRCPKCSSKDFDELICMRCGYYSRE